MGAEFIAEEGVLKGLILSLERGEEWTIGRDPDLSTIAIEDPKASRVHMRVWKTDEGYYIENLSETNPVLLGGEPITGPTLLQEEDLITLGGSLFRFYPEGAPASFGFISETSDADDEDEFESFEEELGEEQEREEAASSEEPAAEKEAFEEHEPAIDEEQQPEEIFDSEAYQEEPSDLHIDLTQTTRFILKVIAGPNTGAEFALDLGKNYVMGTDTASCDIVFNDLSVSREHARLKVDSEGKITIEDLRSRNGVIIDKERVSGVRDLAPNSVVSLGTSAFLVIDREAPSETIAAPLFEAPAEEEERLEEAEEAETKEAAPLAAKAPPRPRRPLPVGSFILSLFICGLAILLGIALVSLLRTQDIEVARKDKVVELQNVIKQYPAVRYTYNPSTGKLFLMGHVQTGIEHNELLYQLKALGFLVGIEDNVVNDEAVWQEMNILLSKHEEFKGVNMHSPEPGVFVISGYLKTEKQAADLMDYLNVNFNYLNLLQNRVVVEESILEEVSSKLVQSGFPAVNATLSGGELSLTGYINSTEIFNFDKLTEDFKKMAGVRAVRNFVVPVTPELGVVDLNKKYSAQSALPRYRVTGYSMHGNANVNVVINGRILGRGDCLDGYTITSIQPNTIFLEKDGLKYKLEYNKCKSFAAEE